MKKSFLSTETGTEGGRAVGVIPFESGMDLSPAARLLRPCRALTTSGLDLVPRKKLRRNGTETGTEGGRAVGVITVGDMMDFSPAAHLLVPCRSLTEPVVDTLWYQF